MFRFTHRLSLALLAATTAPAAAETLDLTPDAGAWTTPVRVQTMLRVRGVLTPETSDGREPTPQPVQAEVETVYRQEGMQSGRAGWPRVMRVVDRGSLRDDRRTLLADGLPTGARVASVGGPLSRGEADLVQLPADPLDVDALLPGEPKGLSGAWKVDAGAVRRVLRLDSTDVCEVTGLVVEATPDHAKLRFAGTVQGRVDGAAAEIDLRGVALFDRREGRLTRINLGWKESRKVGPATPALEATAKLNLTITPGDETERIGADELLLAAASQPNWRLEVPVADGRWRLLADRDWFVVASDRRATTLRRVVDGRVVAMTTLVAAARREPSLADYAQRVRYHLGERLGRITHTGESRSDEGVRRLAIASVGEESGQPVEWRHHHLAGPDGSLAATTTLPADDAAANDAAVVRLVESATPVERLETASAADALAR